MSIRKEQILLILVLLLGAWLVKGYLKDSNSVRRTAFNETNYKADAFGALSLVDTAAGDLKRRDLMTEPSETRPLPPRELSFPPRAPLSLAGLPLRPGPDLAHSWLLERSGAPVSGVTIQRTGEAGEEESGGGAGAPQPGSGTEPQEPSTRGMDKEQAAKLYDRIWYGGLGSPSFGRIEAPVGTNLFALEESGDFGSLQMRMRVFSFKKGRLGELRTFGVKGQEIDRIQLAGTVRNEVQRRLRKVPEDGSYQDERLDLIAWLLQRARVDAWIYDEALKQAEVYLQLSGGTVDGRRVMQRVLQARGDIEGELALLEGSTGDVLADAFRLRGLGVIKERLGLFADAEEDLRGAAELHATDAQNHAALAAFLLARGRSGEALAAAKRATETLGSVQNDDDRRRVQRTILSCRLAVGDIAGAKQLATSLASSYLRGCVAYAEGDFAAALAAFRQEGTGPDNGAAALGQAVCLCETGEWQQAHDLYVRVADEQPLLRDRAMAGLALMFSRLGLYDDALGFCDRSLEAAPGDAYTLYVRGRTLRLMEQYPAANEALTEALRVRDDFGHAIAEMSAVQTALAAGLVGEEQASALIASRRYLDRAVDLSSEPRLELYELQGLRSFAANDWRAARTAFEAARDLAETDEAKGYGKGALAVVAYSRGRVEDAMASLNRMERDLGRDSALAQWSGTALVAIEDHAQKEALGDSFDRDKVGDIWHIERDGQLGPEIRDGKLQFVGSLTSGGPGEVYVERVNAVPKAKNFLACKVDLQLGAGHDKPESFVGLGIEVRQGRGRVDLSARVGLEDGKPLVLIVDGRDNGRANEVRQKLDPALLRSGEAQELELRVQPRSLEEKRRLNLQVWFNGALVLTHELKQLTGSSSTELKTLLFASGSKRSRVDVSFDNYELERRKDNR
ncbi:MAG: tetratricopeptide repeat protein [Planctomycetota bacterium]